MTVIFYFVLFSIFIVARAVHFKQYLSSPFYLSSSAVLSELSHLKKNSILSNRDFSTYIGIIPSLWAIISSGSGEVLAKNRALSIVTVGASAWSALRKALAYSYGILFISKSYVQSLRRIILIFGSKASIEVVSLHMEEQP